MPDTSKRTQNEVNYAEVDNEKEKGAKCPAVKKRTITMTREQYINFKKHYYI